MNIRCRFSSNNNYSLSSLFTIFIFSLVLAGCTSSIPVDNDPVVMEPADEMKAGPGLFSGEKGGFYILGGDKKAKAQTVSSTRPVTKSVSNMDLNETSQVLDDKIRQLQRDQMELELLKREVDKKLKN